VVLGVVIGAVVAVAALVMATTVGSSPGAGRSPAPTEASSIAPGFDLPRLGASGRVSLAAYAGRPVLVNFFSSWCAPCQQETPLLARTARQISARVRVVGVDVDDPSTAALAFIHAKGVGYPVGFDPKGAVAGEYGVSAAPQTFFLNTRHVIVARVFGALTLAVIARDLALIATPAPEEKP
jgi:cytochrome c biogenesis protein CcmG/thiol:disulfide interchange protein DsbE